MAPHVQRKEDPDTRHRSGARKTSGLVYKREQGHSFRSEEDVRLGGVRLMDAALVITEGHWIDLLPSHKQAPLLPSFHSFVCRRGQQVHMQMTGQSHADTHLIVVDKVLSDDGDERRGRKKETRTWEA